MADWTTKLGVTGKPLILALSDAAGLVTFASLGSPMLKLRKRHQDLGDAVSVPVIAYEDEPETYNAQVEFDAAVYAQLESGEYIAEVDATLAGESVTFPDDGYLVLKFLRGVD